MTRRPTDAQTLRTMHRAGTLAGAEVRLREAPDAAVWSFLERECNPETLPARMTWRDPWRGHDVSVWPGPTCEVCECRTWCDDYNADPRGAIGLRQYSPLIASDYGHTGHDFALCEGCSQEQPRYRIAVTRAVARWNPKPAPIPTLELEEPPRL